MATPGNNDYERKLSDLAFSLKGSPRTLVIIIPTGVRNPLSAGKPAVRTQSDGKQSTSHAQTFKRAL